MVHRSEVAVKPPPIRRKYQGLKDRKLKLFKHGFRIPPVVYYIINIIGVAKEPLKGGYFLTASLFLGVTRFRRR